LCTDEISSSIEEDIRTIFDHEGIINYLTTILKQALEKKIEEKNGKSKQNCNKKV
jgi:hypothetical protein